MVGEKKEEDIVGRLEALRKKVPPPTTDKPPEKPRAPQNEVEDEKRKRLARIVGILVIIIVLGAVFLVGSRFFQGPEETPPPGVTTAPPTGIDDAEQQAKLAELAKAKDSKINDVEEAYAGLPSGYQSGKTEKIREIETSNTKSSVESVEFMDDATDAWKSYRNDEVDEVLTGNGEIIGLFGDDIVKGAGSIKDEIGRSSLSVLKRLVIKISKSEFIPIRLPRVQVTGGFADVGDRVNIHYRWDQNVNGTIIPRHKYLAKDGMVVSMMRAAGTISLSETEQQSQSGGGTEGKGNVTQITLGSSSISISDGPYGASVGIKQLQKSSTYTVNLAEVQKAAAASKISEEELMEDLANYGVRLTEIERDTNIGDLNAEYLMLVEVTEDEAREIVMRLLNSNEKANIFIAKTS